MKKQSLQLMDEGEELVGSNNFGTIIEQLNVIIIPWRIPIVIIMVVLKII